MRLIRHSRALMVAASMLFLSSAYGGEAAPIAGNPPLGAASPP
mgnify:CR=1 FL=1